MTAVPLWMRIKLATDKAVHDAQGQKVAAAIASRIDRPATFSDYANPNDIKRVIPLDTAIELDAHNLSRGIAPRLIGLAARALGFLLVREPAVCRSGGPLGRITAKALKETSEVFMLLGAALEDDEIAAAEADRLETEIDEAVAKLIALKLQIRAEAGGEGE